MFKVIFLWVHFEIYTLIESTIFIRTDKHNLVIYNLVGT